MVLRVIREKTGQHMAGRISSLNGDVLTCDLDFSPDSFHVAGLLLLLLLHNLVTL